MAVLTVMVGLRVPPLSGWREAVTLTADVAFAFLLTVIAFIDLDHQLVLNALTYPGTALGLAAALLHGRLGPAVVAGIGAGALLLLIVVASRGGMGLGDVKLAVLIGVFLASPAVTAVALFLAFVLGGAVGIVLLALRRRGRKDAIPFGPFLALGGLGALFWGEAIVAWYLF